MESISGNKIKRHFGIRISYIVVGGVEGKGKVARQGGWRRLWWKDRYRSERDKKEKVIEGMYWHLREPGEVRRAGRQTDRHTWGQVFKRSEIGVSLENSSLPDWNHLVLGTGVAVSHSPHTCAKLVGEVRQVHVHHACKSLGVRVSESEWCWMRLHI